MLPLIHLELLSRKLPRGAVFSGRTAAWLHGLDLPPCDPVEITLPRLATTSRRAGMSVRRSDLREGDASFVQSLPVTSATRTVADLGRREPLVEAVVALDMALQRRVVDRTQVKTWIDAHPGCHGLKRLRQAFDLSDAKAESPMETRLRLVLVLNGLRRPVVQPYLYDDGGMFIARPDLYYPDALLAIEFDGGVHRNALVTDNRRQNRILEAGYRLLRFTAGDVFHAPAAVVGQVERALSDPARRGAVTPA